MRVRATILLATVAMVLAAGCSDGDSGMLTGEPPIDRSPPDPGCQVDADCNDGLFCNGVETCGEDGQCSRGVAPCGSFAGCNDTTDACQSAVALDPWAYTDCLPDCGCYTEDPPGSNSWSVANEVPNQDLGLHDHGARIVVERRFRQDDKYWKGNEFLPYGCSFGMRLIVDGVGEQAEGCRTNAGTLGVTDCTATLDVTIPIP